MSDSSSNVLEIHILGAGRGESIILRLPDGNWGVVDCCASSTTDQTKNATLEFLKSRGVRDLEFLCLTHPHDDHYKGMSHLLGYCNIKYFWQFNGLSGTGFIQLIEFLHCDAEAIDTAEERESAVEFNRIFTILKDKRKRAKTPLPTIFRLGTGTLVYPVPLNESARFRIVAIAPPGNLVNRYEAQLAGCFNPDGTIKEKYPVPDHNMVSVALLVIHGDTRVILGGDVERDGWDYAIRQMGAEKLSAHLVKVSHHGSENSYCDRLWEHHSARGKPFAIVTSYVSKNLPRRRALDEASRYSRAILLTCGTAIKTSEFPQGLNQGEFLARLALVQKMGTVSDESSHACGRWTFAFDDRGNCGSWEPVDPAMILVESPAPAQ
jgi:hypothetical protein